MTGTPAGPAKNREGAKEGEAAKRKQRFPSRLSPAARLGGLCTTRYRSRKRCPRTPRGGPWRKKGEKRRVGLLTFGLFSANFDQTWGQNSFKPPADVGRSYQRQGPRCRPCARGDPKGGDSNGQSAAHARPRRLLHDRVPHQGPAPRAPEPAAAHPSDERPPAGVAPPGGGTRRPRWRARRCDAGPAQGHHCPAHPRLPYRHSHGVRP